MQFSITAALTLALAGTSLAAPASPSNPLSEIATRSGEYQTAGIVGYFGDTSCANGQTDASSADGECRELPGKSMKIWWLAKGCGVVLLTDKQCHSGATFRNELQSCINTENYLSWEFYCYP
ncbi:hypothetical protein MKZ38_005254 [Zalerion maritima]|uniref:Uncharacterized protein n=1 Tax=Zalerion maritima TaxID=339359 RepID=A0AAD5RR74_9PEZI|nr:hypothetical protein MKZ38_005254 [Zalerion maritima]